MTDGAISDRDAIEIVEHILTFSQVYFFAFRVPRNRFRFWRFLLLVLRIQRADENKLINGNFSKVQIKSVLGTTANADNVGHWRRELVSHFREPDGQPFLEEDKVLGGRKVG